MKKNIIALAIVSAFATPAVMAEAPTVYGQANIAIDSVNDKGMFTTDRDSRLGIKGSEDLGNGLSAVYQMEFGVDLTGGDGATSGASLSTRNTYVGLAGGFGTVLMGRHDTPLKMSQANDLFGDSTYADMGKKTMAGGLGYAKAAGEVRANDVVAYVSPSFSGVKLMVAGINGVTPDVSTDASDTKLTNAVSGAVMYGSTKEGLYLAAAMNYFGADYSGLNHSYTENRFSAQYAASGLVANVTYQTFDDGLSSDAGTDNPEGANTQAQLGYKMGKFMPKAKYSVVDYANTANKDATAYALGLDYSLGKKTTGYVEVVQADKYMVGAAGNTSALDSDTSAVSVGMVHKF